MSDRALLLATAATLAATAGTAHAQRTDWTPADSSYRWSFPRDHWSHDGYKTEWWYLTGHLTPAGAATPRFGYQFTFFRIGLLPDRPDVASAWAARDLVMGHAAVTDLATGRHVFSELLYRAVPLLGGFPAHPDATLAWSLGPAGTDRLWRLGWNGAAFTFEAHDARQGLSLALTTRPAKPLVFQGPNGFSRKGPGPGAASQYYSFTRLETEGTVILAGDTAVVTGLSWMDKEFGSNQLAEGQVGWDWFSLQLDDGREVMLYHLRGTAGTPDFRRGTLVEASGAARHVGGQDWRLETVARWRSPETGADYPAAWRLRVGSWDLDAVVRPVAADQENVSRLVPGLAYWEGAVVVLDADGRTIGRGYVELTGYVPGGRLPI